MTTIKANEDNDLMYRDGLSELKKKKKAEEDISEAGNVDKKEEGKLEYFTD